MNPGQTLIARTAIGETTGTYLRRSGQGSLRSSLPRQRQRKFIRSVDFQGSDSSSWQGPPTSDAMTMSLRIATIISYIRSAAPYLAIELILPGGSLIALCLWLVRNRARRRNSVAICS
jgi:hypothetical protein